MDYPEYFDSYQKAQIRFELALDALLLGASKAAKDIAQRVVLEVGPTIIDVIENFVDVNYENSNDTNTQDSEEKNNK